MGASLRKDDAVQYSRVRRALPAAVLSLTLALVAACGGDRSRAAGGSDTTGAAAMPIDTATAPGADTAAPPARDTSTKTAAAPAPAAAPAKPAEPKPAEPKPAAAKPAAPKPAAPAPQDTAPKAAAAAPAKPAAPAQPAETTKAQAPAPTPTADAPLRDEYHQAPRDTVSAAVYDGWKQYNLNCARCHGEDALGTTIAPHLIVSLKPDGPINTKELFMQVVCAGRTEKGMPAWCALGLDMGKIDDIYQYVKGRSDAKISPGRPAVKPEG